MSIIEAIELYNLLAKDPKYSGLSIQADESGHRVEATRNDGRKVIATSKSVVIK